MSPQSAWFVSHALSWPLIRMYKSKMLIAIFLPHASSFSYLMLPSFTKKKKCIFDINERRLLLNSCLQRCTQLSKQSMREISCLNSTSKFSAFTSSDRRRNEKDCGLLDAEEQGPATELSCLCVPCKLKRWIMCHCLSKVLGTAVMSRVVFGAGCIPAFEVLATICEDRLCGC